LETRANRPLGSLIAWVDANVCGAWFKRTLSPVVDEGFDLENSFADMW
jgi:hypothetical protein